MGKWGKTRGKIGGNRERELLAGFRRGRRVDYRLASDRRFRFGREKGWKRPVARCIMRPRPRAHPVCMWTSVVLPGTSCFAENAPRYTVYLATRASPLRASRLTETLWMLMRLLSLVVFLSTACHAAFLGSPLMAGFTANAQEMDTKFSKREDPATRFQNGVDVFVPSARNLGPCSRVYLTRVAIFGNW